MGSTSGNGGEDIDPMAKYLNGFIEEKDNKVDRKKIAKMFNQYADEPGENGHPGALSKEKAQLAQEKLFEEWEIDLTSEQEQKFAVERFEPAWKEFAGKYDYSKLNADNAIKFLRKAMSYTDEEKEKLQSIAQKQALVQKQTKKQKKSKKKRAKANQRKES